MTVLRAREGGARDVHHTPRAGRRGRGPGKRSEHRVTDADLRAGLSHDTADGGEYGITDLGATFGRTGNSITRSKGVPKDYADTRFIDEVTPTHVDFVMQSRPFFPLVFHLPSYRSRTKMESIVKHVPIADARWIGNRLGQLSRNQIRDCFRAAGFSPDEVEMYAQVVMQRIAALKNLHPDSED